MEKILKKYAELLVRLGVNLQKDEEAFISAQTETAPFVRMVAEEAYRAGARKVTINWYDEKITRIKYLNESKDALVDIHDWLVKRAEEMVDRKAVIIHIISDDPAILEGIDPSLISAVGKTTMEKNQRYYDATMSGNIRWTLGAYPNEKWAETVFGKDADAVEKLWKLIAAATRLDKEDTLGEWGKFQKDVDRRVNVLNEAKVKHFRFKNSVGTDLTVGMPKGYIFKGGAHVSPSSGVLYMPNLPTEEVFSAPDRLLVNGKVVASMPLIYSGNKIDGFWLEFKDGKVINFHADKGEENLKELLDTDEGSRYLGEIALVGFNSPIQNLKTLFYNTLFDENASCHLALGRAYPDCVEGGNDMTPEQLKEAGLNYSLEHEDFMFGTADMSVTALCENGKEITIFSKGDWVI